MSKPTFHRDRKSELEITESILSQPTRNCDLAHETPKTDASGKILYEIEHQFGKKSLILVDECPDSNKHPGCPHLENIYDTVIFPTLSAMAECIDLSAEYERMHKRQRKLDSKIRIMRTRKYTGDDAIDIRDIPAEVAATKHLIEEFDQNNAKIEELRVQLLPKVREALKKALEPQTGTL